MKTSHLLMVGILALSAGYAMAQEAQVEQTQALTTEQLNAINTLKAALDAAATPQEKADALAEAIAANPELTTDFEAVALNAGLAPDLIAAALVTGLSNAEAAAAGGGQQLTQNQQQNSGTESNFSSPTTSNTSGGGGGGTASGG